MQASCAHASLTDHDYCFALLAPTFNTNKHTSLLTHTTPDYFSPGSLEQLCKFRSIYKASWVQLKAQILLFCRNKIQKRSTYFFVPLWENSTKRCGNASSESLTKICLYEAKYQCENCHLQCKDPETPSRLTHFIWCVLSQQVGKRTSRKAENPGSWPSGKSRKARSLLSNTFNGAKINHQGDGEGRGENKL